MASLFPNFNSQWVALTATVSLHAGIAAWALLPAGAAEVPRQVIRITMVAPSTPDMSAAQTQPQEEPAAVIPPAPEGVKKTAEKQKPKPGPVKEQAQNLSQLSPTSGKPAPDATARQSAITEPQFAAAYLNNPAPAYPDSARKRGVEGKTLLQVDVSKEGVAQHVAVARSSGSDTLDEAAREAVSRWRFVPAQRGDEAVEAKVIVPVLFKLD